MSDGHRVVVAFKTGEVLAYDLEGNRQWIHQILTEDGNVSPPVSRSSPLLADGNVVIYLNGPARFLCLEAATGKRRWNTDLRDANGKLMRSPAALRRNGTWYACSPGGTMVNVTDGTVVTVTDTCPPRVMIGKGGGTSYFMPASACPEAGIFDCGWLGVVAPAKVGEAGQVVWRVPIAWLQQNLTGGAAPLTLDEWDALLSAKSRPNDPRLGGFAGERHFAAGVARDGIVYSYSSSHQTFAARDFQTGDLIYMKNLSDKPVPNSCEYADLCLAGDYIFVNNGQTILKVGREFNLVKRMRTFGHFACNLVFDGSVVFGRDARNLICLGRKSSSHE